MSEKKLSNLISEVANEIGFLAYEARSTDHVLRNIVNEIECMPDAVSKAPPFSSLPGALILVGMVADKLEKLEKVSDEMLKMGAAKEG